MNIRKIAYTGLALVVLAGSIASGCANRKKHIHPVLSDREIRKYKITEILDKEYKEAEELYEKEAK